MSAKFSNISISNCSANSGPKEPEKNEAEKALLALLAGFNNPGSFDETLSGGVSPRTMKTKSKSQYVKKKFASKNKGESKGKKAKKHGSETPKLLEKDKEKKGGASRKVSPRGEKKNQN